MRSVASLMLGDVPGHRLRDSSFWTLAYRPLVHARPENGPKHLYERLLPYLNSRPLLSNVPAGLSKKVSGHRLAFEGRVLLLIMLGPRENATYHIRQTDNPCPLHVHFFRGNKSLIV